MAIWVERANRLRLAGLGLTQHVWSTDWLQWFEAVQDKGNELQAEAMDAGQTFFEAHALIKPLALKPICQAVGAVDLVVTVGQHWFDVLVQAGRDKRQALRKSADKSKNGQADGKAVISQKRSAGPKGAMKPAVKSSAKTDSQTKLTSTRKSQKPKTDQAQKKVASAKGGVRESGQQAQKGAASQSAAKRSASKGAAASGRRAASRSTRNAAKPSSSSKKSK